MSARPDWQLRPHGTLAAARRHRRRGTPLCESCRQAEAIRTDDYRERHPEWAAARAAELQARYRVARDAGLSRDDAKRASTSQARLDRLIADRREAVHA